MSETFIIGDREFTCQRMNAFAASKLQMRLQKVVVPVLGALVGSGKTIGDIDVAQAAATISEHLTEEMLETIVLPMFAEARVYANEPKRFVKSAADIDAVFSAETLFDFYELIFEVGKYQFAPFFGAMAGRFGHLLKAEKPAKE